jgi:hypothetical protein
MLKFKGCRLARMSSGRYCVIRDLGLVKGGKGMKHHEVMLTFTPKGLLAALRSVKSLNHSRDRFTKVQESHNWGSERHQMQPSRPPGKR